MVHCVYLTGPILWTYDCGMETAWYRDGAGNTVEENSSVFSLIRVRSLPSVL